MPVEAGTSRKEKNGNSMQETAAELGAKLRELREAQGLSLDDVNTAIKIQKKYIEAIEEGNTGLIPKGPFCRSFIKQYCEYLKADDLWLRYSPDLKDINTVPATSPSRDAAARALGEKTPYRRRSLLRICIPAVMILSLAAAVWITLQYRGEIAKDATTPLEGGTAAVREESSKDLSADIVPSADAVRSAPVSSVDLSWMDGRQSADKQQRSQDMNFAAAAVKSAENAASGNALPELSVTADGVVWVKFSIGDKILFQGTMKKGEIRSFSPAAGEPLRARYGNPPKTLVSWRGAPAEKAGSVARPLTRYYYSDGSVSDVKR